MITDTKVDILCGCGWGRLGVSLDAILDAAEADGGFSCPVCGHGFPVSDDDEAVS